MVLNHVIEHLQSMMTDPHWQGEAEWHAKQYVKVATSVYDDASMGGWSAGPRQSVTQVPKVSKQQEPKQDPKVHNTTVDETFPTVRAEAHEQNVVLQYVERFEEVPQVTVQECFVESVMIGARGSARGSSAGALAP